MRYNPGYLDVRAYFVKYNYTRTFDVKPDKQNTSFAFEFDGTNVDLLQGTIKCDMMSEDIPERIAFAFCVSMLHTLCQPRPRNWTSGNYLPSRNARKGAQGLHMSNSKMMRACGLLQDTPSNHYVKHSQIGSDESLPQDSNEDRQKKRDQIYRVYGLMLLKMVTDKNRNIQPDAEHEPRHSEQQVEESEESVIEGNVDEMTGIFNELDRDLFADDSIFSKQYGNLYDEVNNELNQDFGGNIDDVGEYMGDEVIKYGDVTVSVDVNDCEGGSYYHNADRNNDCGQEDDE